MSKHLLSAVCVSLCLLSIPLSTSFAQRDGNNQERSGGREGRRNERSGHAREENRREENRGEGNRRGEENDGEEEAAPAATRNKFPGMGSFDAWKSSLPELSAAQKCMRDKQWDQAIAHYKASLDLYEFQPRCYLQMGRALQRKSASVEDQEKCFRKALKLNESNWQAWKELANVLYITKRYDEARSSLASAIQLNPPAQGKLQLERMIRDVDSAQRNSDTGGRNTEN